MLLDSAINLEKNCGSILILNLSVTAEVLVILIDLITVEVLDGTE